MTEGQNITDWLTAFGTCVEVVISVLGKTIRTWWNRPENSISCSKSKPCLEEVVDGSSSNDEE